MSSPKRFFKKPSKEAVRSHVKTARKVSPVQGIPLLDKGPASNLMFWGKTLKSHLLREYGDFATFIDEDEHFEPPAVEYEADELGEEADPHGIRLAEIKAEQVERTKEVKLLKRHWTPVYALILAVISVEIEEGIKELEGYEEAERLRDPLLLLRLVQRCAMGEGRADNPRNTARLAREAFHSLRQRDGEENPDYHERFKFAAAQMLAHNSRSYTDANGREVMLPFLSEAEIAEQFLNSLSSEHARFVDDTTNSAMTGAADMPNNLADMYARLCSFKETAAKGYSRGGKSVFATMQADDTGDEAPRKAVSKKPKPKAVSFKKPPSPKKSALKKKGDPPDLVSDDESDNESDASKDVECFQCHKKGHYARDCPSKDKANASKKGNRPIPRYTMALYTLGMDEGDHFHPNDVILDGGASTSRFANERLLVPNTLRENTGHIQPVIAVGGETFHSIVSGFFRPMNINIGVCPDFRVNILSLHEMESRAVIKYVQGRYFDITVRREPGERSRATHRFVKDERSGLFIKRFPTMKPDRSESNDHPEPHSRSDRDTPEDEDDDHSSYTLSYLERQAVNSAERSKLSTKRLEDGHTSAEGETKVSSRVYSTVAERRSQLPARRLAEADRAWDFVTNANVTQATAIEMATKSADIHGCKISRQAILDAFSIHGSDVAQLRGKTRRQNPSTSTMLTQVPATSVQTMYCDVMHIREQKTLISVLDPLLLVIGSAITSETGRMLCQALEDQIDVLRAKGVRVRAVRVDRHQSLLTLRGKLGEVDVEACGAGDHVGRAENKIKTIKEMFRSVVARLPWRLARRLISDLISFVIKRLNSQPSSSGHNTSPRVSITGVKIDFDKEYMLGFGDYVETRNPMVKSNDAEQLRTQSAIALYPVGNHVGSWKLMLLSNGETVTRSQMTKLPCPDVVIARMNEIYEEDEKIASSAKKSSSKTSEVGNLLPTLDEELSDEEDDDYVPNLSPGSDSDSDSDPDSDQPPDDTPRRSRRLRGANAEEMPDLVDDDSSDDEEEPPPRRSSRVPKRPDVSHKFLYHISLKRGLSLFGDVAEQSVAKEIQNMISKEVFEPVDIKKLSKSERAAIIRSSIFLKEKFKADGSFDKLKARLVADGSMQEKSLYTSLTSPTVSTTSLLCLIALFASEGRQVSTIDIGSAYLNCDIDVAVTMMLDIPLAKIVCKVWPEMKAALDAKGRAYVRLKKALYGCVQSSKLWYERLKAELLNIGYVMSPLDQCVFNKMYGKLQSTLLVHVDDILCASEYGPAHTELSEHLKKVFVDINYDTGTRLSFLGMTISFEIPGRAIISMQGFVDEFVGDYPGDKKVTSPSNNELFDIYDEDVLVPETDRKSFHTIVAKLLYLGKRIRPDILLTVGFLCTRVTKVTERDMIKLKRLVNYVCCTKDRTLTLQVEYPVRLFCFVDASYGVHMDGKSHTGAVVTLGAGCILAKSSKQKIVTKSSTEAELVAITDCLGDLTFVRDLLLYQGYDVPALFLFQDNKSTIVLCEKGGAGHRTKHIKIRNFFVKEKLDDGEVVIRWIRTELMIADVLTKPLQGATFKAFTDLLTGEMVLDCLISLV